jgi:hypothetical protein
VAKMPAEETDYNDKVAIPAELWLSYKSDPGFSEFFEFNDLGLPLAYAIDNEIVSSTPLAEPLINETFSLLLEKFDVEDSGFEVLDDILES